MSEEGCDVVREKVEDALRTDTYYFGDSDGETYEGEYFAGHRVIIDPAAHERDNDPSSKAVEFKARRIFETIMHEAMHHGKVVGSHTAYANLAKCHTYAINFEEQEEEEEEEDASGRRWAVAVAVAVAVAAALGRTVRAARQPPRHGPLKGH